MGSFAKIYRKLLPSTYGPSFFGVENILSFRPPRWKIKAKQKADQLFDGKGPKEKIERINSVEIRLLGMGKLREKTQKKKKKVKESGKLFLLSDQTVCFLSYLYTKRSRTQKSVIFLWFPARYLVRSWGRKMRRKKRRLLEEGGWNTLHLYFF